jgi:hypothetical protein
MYRLASTETGEATVFSRFLFANKIGIRMAICMAQAPEV